MKLSYKLVIAAFFFTVIGSFIWSANHYYSKYQHEKKRADEAVQNAKSATVITNNVLQSLQIVNTVLEATRQLLMQPAPVVSCACRSLAQVQARSVTLTTVRH